MRRFFALALAAFGLLYVLAEGTLERPPADGVVRLRWASDPNPARNVQTAIFGKLQAGRIEVSVESGAQERLIVQCATGTGPDIIDCYNMNHMRTLVQAGIVLDLTPFAEKMGFGPSSTYPAIRDVLKVDGRQYRFPCNVWANCVVFNRKILADHDVEPPKEGWTYDDFIRIGRQIVAAPGRSGQRHLAVAHFSQEWLYNDLLIGHGGRYFSPDGLTSRLDAPEAVAALRLYHDLMHVHKVIPTPGEAAAMSSQGGWASGAISWFSNARAAMIFIGRWYLCQAVKYPEIHGRLGAVRLPRVGDRPSAGVTDTRAAGVNVTSPHRAEALRFLQYLAGRDYGRVIVEDGDSLPPNPALARTGRDLVNSVEGDPNFHQPFIDAMQTARPLDSSPFIDGGEVSRWVLETVSRIENRLVEPDQAARALAAEINQRIRLNIARRPDLQRRYEQVTGRPYVAGQEVK